MFQKGGGGVVFVHSKIQSWEHLCVYVANFEISVFVHRKIILRRHFHLVSKIPIIYLNWAKFRGYDEHEKGPLLDRETFIFSSYPWILPRLNKKRNFQYLSHWWGRCMGRVHSSKDLNCRTLPGTSWGQGIVHGFLNNVHLAFFIVN